MSNKRRFSTCCALSITRVAGSTFILLADDFQINDLNIYRRPDRMQIRMIDAGGKRSTFPNDDLATATDALINAELSIDLSVFRHTWPRLPFAL